MVLHVYHDCSLASGYFSFDEALSKFSSEYLKCGCTRKQTLILVNIKMVRLELTPLVP